jgi:hypothetical protein
MTARAPTISARSYSVIVSTSATGASRRLCDDGESIDVAIFSGGDARERAIRYADREYRAFDEIELEPYARLDPR